MRSPASLSGHRSVTVQQRGIIYCSSSASRDCVIQTGRLVEYRTEDGAASDSASPPADRPARSSSTWTVDTCADCMADQAAAKVRPAAGSGRYIPAAAGGRAARSRAERSFLGRGAGRLSVFRPPAAGL